MLLLAAEFQGFARELHDLSASTFASWAAPGNQVLEQVIKGRLTENRQLDRGNAQPGSLGSDYLRFGCSLWPGLAASEPATVACQQDLDKLNDARNAIAHADEAKLAGLRGEGYPLTLATFRQWRRSLDLLAVTMDAEVASHLGQLFGQPAPW
jgi:hypothetical protein